MLARSESQMKPQFSPAVPCLEPLEPRLLLAANWPVQVVDEIGDVGRFASMALDSSDHPHVSYYDDTNGDLKYASYDGASWTIETVDSVGDVGMYSSLALDANDRPHISYYDNTNGTLAYATWTGVAWDIQTVDTDYGTGLFTSIAVSRLNACPSISYYDAEGEDLRFASWDGASWDIQTVDRGTAGTVTERGDERNQISGWNGVTGVTLANSDNRKLYASIVVDPNELVDPFGVGLGIWQYRVFLYSDSGRNSKVAETGWYTSPGTQALTQFAGSGIGGTMNVDAVFAQNTSGVDFDIEVFLPPLVVETNDDMNQMNNNDWLGLRGLTLANTSNYTLYVNIVDDGAGFFHADMYRDALRTQLVAYTNPYNSAGAKRVLPSGGSGIGGSIRVDTVIAADPDIQVYVPPGVGGQVGTFSSLALDAVDRPRIAYHDASSGNLKYASYDGASWTIVPVQMGSGHDVGEFVSMALDASGKPRVSYYDSLTGDLMYGYWAAGSWSSVSLDQPVGVVGDDVGLFTSLALDASGKAHITYLDYTTGALKYATYTAAGITTEVIDPTGWGSFPAPAAGAEAGLCTSVAVDSQGMVHVVYFNYTNANLNYTVRNLGPTLTTVTPLTGAQEDTPYTITYAALAAAANESDPENDTISFRVESVTTGTLTKGGSPVITGETLLGPGEELVWTPPANANGPIGAFTIVAWTEPYPGASSTDSTSASAPPASVTIQVAPINDAPTLTTIATLAGGAEDTAYTITYAALLAASDAADIEADPISFRVESVTSGTLTQGGVAVVPGTTLLTAASQPLVWMPAANAFGTLGAFAVIARDDTSSSSLAIPVRVNVAESNVAPTLTVVNTLPGLAEDTPVTITYAALAAAANEADADGDVLSFRVEAVTTGTLTKAGVAVTPGVTLLGVGEQLVWTPAPNANGLLNAFTVRAWDGRLASAAAVQVRISVTPDPAPDFTVRVLLKKGKKIDPADLLKNRTPKIQVQISNIGNLASTSPVGLDLFVSTSTTFDPLTATQLASATLDNTKKALMPGRTKKFKFGGRIAPALPAGYYNVFVRINPNQAVVELDYLNNIDMAAPQLQWM